MCADYDRPECEPSGCRWIDGDPLRNGWRFCQEKTPPGGVWCATHRKRVFREMPKDGPVTNIIRAAGGGPGGAAKRARVG